MDQLRGRPRTTHVGLRRHVPALELELHLRRRLQGRARRRRHRAGPGMLQPRRPLHRRRRRADGARRVDPARAAALAELQEGPQRRASSRPRTGPPRHASSKGACIFHNQPDFAGGAGCALHIAAVEAGERLHRLEARRVLAAAAAARTPHRRQRLRHLDPARVEAARLGRRRRRLPLVVHRERRRVHRQAARLPVPARRDHRDGRPGRSTTRWSSCSSARSGPRSPTPPSAAADDRLAHGSGPAPERSTVLGLPRPIS